MRFRLREALDAGAFGARPWLEKPLWLSLSYMHVVLPPPPRHESEDQRDAAEEEEQGEQQKTIPEPGRDSFDIHLSPDGSEGHALSCGADESGLM